jgi:hypothetical protein
MRYTVTSSDAVEQQLADCWLRAPDQRAAQEASDTIDRLLKSSAERVGEDLGDRRRLVVGSLRVTFRIKPLDRQVELLGFELLGP